MPRSAPTGSHATRQRLLEAAAQTFLAHGFEGASTREICERAQANIAAISYHFGSKEELYRAVLQLPLTALEASIPRFADPGLPLAEALHALFAAMLAPLRPGGPEAAAMRLMARTFHGPDSDRGRPDAEVPCRHNAAVRELLRRHLPAGCAEPAVAFLAGALVGMAMHAVFSGIGDPRMPRMLEAPADDAGVEAVVRRLTAYGCALVAAERGSAP